MAWHRFGTADRVFASVHTIRNLPKCSLFVLMAERGAGTWIWSSSERKLNSAVGKLPGTAKRFLICSEQASAPSRRRSPVANVARVDELCVERDRLVGESRRKYVGKDKFILGPQIRIGKKRGEVRWSALNLANVNYFFMSCRETQLRCLGRVVWPPATDFIVMAYFVIAFVN